MTAIRSGLSWMLGVFLFVLFALAAAAKFVGAPGDNMVFSILADRLAQPWIEPMGRYGVGVAEALAAALLAFSATRRWGALVAFLILLGAAAAHLSPFLGVEIPEAAGSLATDGGSLFRLALVGLALSLVLMALAPGAADRRSIKGR